MRDTCPSHSVTLRGRAAHCRDIAANALSENIAREMLVIAEQYDREADETLPIRKPPLAEVADA